MDPLSDIEGILFVQPRDLYVQRHLRKLENALRIGKGMIAQAMMSLDIGCPMVGVNWVNSQNRRKTTWFPASKSLEEIVKLLQDAY